MEKCVPKFSALRRGGTTLKNFILISITLLLFSSCAPIPIKDFEVCADGGDFGATCAHFLTTETRDMDKQTWDAARVGELCISGDAYGQIKAEIEQLCSVTNRCSYEQIQMVNQFAQRIEMIRRHPGSPRF